MKTLTPIARGPLVRAAHAVLSRGGWCVLEVCSDSSEQQWDAVVLIFHLDAEEVADAVTEELEQQPELDARLTGCHRLTLGPAPEMGAHLCYLAGAAA